MSSPLMAGMVSRWAPGINLKGGVEDSHGVTANHAGSASGPNHLQNYPVLSALSLLPGQTLGALTVQLSGLPNTSYGIDLYRDTAPNASGYGEGQYYLGTQSVTTDGNGNYTGSMSFVLGQNSVGQYLSATATNLTTGDTSEFGLTQLLASALKSWSSSAATPSGQSSSPAASGGTS